MKLKFKSLATAAVAVTLGAITADACTRVVYLGPEGRIFTARSMDWRTDIGTNLWILPRGVERTGEGRLATLHLSQSDASGDSAILEYIGGEPVIHHSRAHQVMINSPTFDRQLALAEYWNEIGGTVMLPGTNRAADRFVRASFHVNAIPQTEHRRDATRLPACSA